MPLAEKLVWFRLRGKQLTKFRFQRHCNIGPYVLDFYCPSMRLAIEIGSTTWDEMKERHLTTYGIRVLRFSTLQVFKHFDDVVQEITCQLRIIFQQGTFFSRK